MTAITFIALLGAAALGGFLAVYLLDTIGD